MSTSKSQVGLGIIGCGKISQAYFDGAQVFEVLKMVGCADLNMEAAIAKAEENHCQAMTVDELLAHPKVDLVINLTIPAAHASVSRQVLNAGKHVYCEKPLTVELKDAQAVLQLAEDKGLLVGCAPDTFLGAGYQTCRQLIDQNAIGRVVSGTVHMMGRGPEGWHPNPGFYYLKGGGPVLDMAPYYLTALINMIGPIKRVCAITSKAFDERVAGSEERKGEILPVEVSTHASATMEFHSGAVITAVFSFDVAKHGHSHIELYGTEGSLQAPDPNTFDGPVRLYQMSNNEADWQDQELSHIYAKNMRSIGAADMACSILTGRPHRASAQLAYHVLEIMHAFETSSQSKQFIEIESRVERPAALPTGLREGQLD
ncbi:Gfo/Idh/MocA family protein [Coraliomargarita sp. W4R72]